MNDEELMLLLRRASAMTRRKQSHTSGEPPRKGSGGHGHILAVLSSHDGSSQQELADLLGIRPQSLSEALSVLESDGYIERYADEVDRRCIRVFLTDAGRRRNGELSAIRSERARSLFARLEPGEKATLAELLGRIVESPTE